MLDPKKSRHPFATPRQRTQTLWELKGARHTSVTSERGEATRLRTPTQVTEGVTGTNNKMPGSESERPTNRSAIHRQGRDGTTCL